MKKLSEVCKQIGVNRRTLQKYNDIGLLSPTEKTDQGYWLYDDDAISRLEAIQTFVACGYKPKEIKDMLDEKTVQDANELFDGMLETLEKKRKQMDGMINLVKSWKVASNIPMSVIDYMYKNQMVNDYKEDDFGSYIQRVISDASEISEADMNEMEPYLPANVNIFALGKCKGLPYDSKEVIDCINVILSTFINISCKEIGKEGDDVIKIDQLNDVSGICDAIKESLSNNEAKEMIDSRCGSGATEYICEAFKAYAKNFDEIKRRME